MEIGLPMLLLVTGVSQICSIMLTASGAYRYRANATRISCLTDRANLISTAPCFKFPYPLQWGPPTFSAGHSFAMMSSVLVSMAESTRAYKAASRLAIATPPSAYVLSRGIGWQSASLMEILAIFIVRFTIISSTICN